MMQKSALRQQVRQMKGHFTHNELREMSFQIVGRLLSHPCVTDAHTVMAYSALPDEVQTDLMLAKLLEAHKTVLLPKVLDGETMELRQYTAATDLQEGAFHIMEPVGERFTALSDIDVAIIPGMAFDKQGNRMGRGKGYYDRFLRQLSETVKVGVCFPFQMMEEIPHETHDIRMDFVVC